MAVASEEPWKVQSLESEELMRGMKTSRSFAASVLHHSVVANVGFHELLCLLERMGLVVDETPQWRAGDSKRWGFAERDWVTTSNMNIEKEEPSLCCDFLLRKERHRRRLSYWAA